MPAVSLVDASKVFTVYRRRDHGPLRRILRTRLQVRAVDGVSFDIEEGEIVGYIGPNGAGKSTTVKMLTGILTPTGGQVRVFGLDPARQRIKVTSRIGVVFGQRTQLWWDLPLTDSFELLRHIYRIDKERHARNLGFFREALDLDDFIQSPVRQLSLGQRMRGDLAASMLHDPEILFLDEPTIGLDVVAKARIREFLLEVNRERNVTIMLTTHDMSDMEKLCSRIMIIDQGHLVFDGSIQAIKSRFGGESVLVVDLEEPSSPISVDGAKVVKVDGPRQWLRFKRTEITAADLISRVAQTTRLVDLTIEEPAIEDIIARIYRDRSTLSRHPEAH